jgi:hypothetical protein
MRAVIGSKDGATYVSRSAQDEWWMHDLTALHSNIGALLELIKAEDFPAAAPVLAQVLNDMNEFARDNCANIIDQHLTREVPVTQWQAAMEQEHGQSD